MMIALEVFAVLVLLSLAVGAAMEHFGFKHRRAHKGDAVKTPEEIARHQPRG